MRLHVPMAVVMVCSLAIVGCSSSSGDRSARVAVKAGCTRADYPRLTYRPTLPLQTSDTSQSATRRQRCAGAPLGSPWQPIEVFDDAVGTNVIAWWYQDCGLPGGIVGPGKARPECGASEVAATTP